MRAGNAIKLAGLIAAFVPLGISVVDLYKERAVIESRSVQMEDEILQGFKEINSRISELEDRIDGLELRPTKSKKRKKPRVYQRAWTQQEEPR